MPKIAIGLFETPALAQDTLQKLETNGFSREDIRLISEPRAFADPLTLGALDDAPGGEVGMTTSRNEFEMDLVRELTAAGAPPDEAEAYRRRVRAGATLILVRGADERVDAAADVMSHDGGGPVDELVGTKTKQDGGHVYQAMGDVAHHEQGVLAGRVRSRLSGVRVFIW
jgi:hypothetical protein